MDFKFFKKNKNKILFSCFFICFSVLLVSEYFYTIEDIADTCNNLSYSQTCNYVNVKYNQSGFNTVFKLI